MDQFDTATMRALAGFEDVWQRVTGRSAPVSEEETLRSFIQQEACSAGFYTSLARMFQGSGRTCLLSHAADARRQARRLRAEYFIRTGVSFTPEGACPPVGGKFASLRKAYEQALNTAADFKTAAEQTGSPELKELYLAFGANAAARAQADRDLLIESF